MSVPLRILVVSGYEHWPLNGGGRLMLFHVLRELARRAEVTLALPRAARYAHELPPGLRIEAVGPAGSACPPPSRDDSTAARLARRHFGLSPAAAWLRRAAQRFDVAMLYGAAGALLGPWCRIPWVWDPQDELVLPLVRDLDWRAPRSWPAAIRRAVLYAMYERWAMRHAAATVFVSRVDAGYARRWAGGGRCEVVQNGVDFEYFGALASPATPGTVAFVGSLEFPPNVDGIDWFARRVWPRVRQPGRRLLVVGRRPVAAVRRWAGEAGISLFADVPDVRPYLQQATAVVVPTRKGGGLKNKILEACAAGRPVIASPRALGGLGATPGRELLVATSPASWAAQLETLLARPDRAAALGARGREWVRREHDWADTGRRFYEILAHAAGRRPMRNDGRGCELRGGGRRCERRSVTELHRNAEVAVAGGSASWA